MHHKRVEAIVANARHRRGYTLIESLAVITIGSFVVGTAIVLLAGMWRNEQSAENYDGMLNSIVRVAAQFRDDVHQATSVEMASGNAQSRTSRFTVTLPGERKIEYQAEPGSITRVVREGDQVKHRDSYLLPLSAMAHWEIASTGGNVMASLLINRPLLASSVEPSDIAHDADRRHLGIAAANDCSNSSEK